jgi:hypothetical protein
MARSQPRKVSPGRSRQKPARPAAAEASTSWLTSSASSAVPAVAWLATALRREADEVQAGDPGQATRLRRQGESAARRAARLARRFRADLPHAQRECGLLLAALGRPGKGLRRLEESSSTNSSPLTNTLRCVGPERCAVAKVCLVLSGRSRPRWKKAGKTIRLPSSERSEGTVAYG